MKTYEMVALAESDGKTYKCDDMYYNRIKGFHDKYFEPWSAGAYSDYYDNEGRTKLHAFIMEDKWEIYDAKRMTKKEIEKELGYKIEIV